MSTKIVKLTPSNIEALARMVEYTDTDRVTLTKTTATFAGTAAEALEIVAWFQRAATAEFGATGYPNASLHAVRRKVEALAAADLEAAQARSAARAERDAATDPLVVLLNNTGTHAARIPSVAVRVHAALSDAEMAVTMATMSDRAVSATVAAGALCRAVRGSGRVSGRLLAASKSGQRRPRRSRRGQ